VAIKTTIAEVTLKGGEVVHVDLPVSARMTPQGLCRLAQKLMDLGWEMRGEREVPVKPVTVPRVKPKAEEPKVKFTKLKPCVSCSAFIPIGESVCINGHHQ